MKTFIYLLLLGMILSNAAFAYQFKGAAAFGAGGNLAGIISSPSVGILGSGVGSQFGLAVTAFRERPTALKLRFDTIKSREESILRARTEAMAADSYFRSAEQNWSVLSVNAERIYNSHNRIFFWELGLGYAFGKSGAFRTGSNTLPPQTYDFPTSQNSAFALTAGTGIRKSFLPNLTAIADLHTFIMLGRLYADNPLAQQNIFAIPLMFNISVEYEFGFGK